jgi:sigma-B regulation protein RsbU (phosphoserine phosphatase)
MFLTAALLKLEKNGEARLASLGHPAALLLRRRGGIESITSGGAAAGLVAGETYDDVVFLLWPGDRLLLYTDGFVEAEGPSGELGEEALKRLFTETPEGESPTETTRRLLSALREHLAGQATGDDVTIVVVERTEGS